jgi:hypothetical protein
LIGKVKSTKQNKFSALTHVFCSDVDDVGEKKNIVVGISSLDIFIKSCLYNYIMLEDAFPSSDAGK